MGIVDIIKKGNIKVVFQPIMSTHNPEFMGFEALVRGVDEDGDDISPVRLFEEAMEDQCVLELDKLCIQKVLKSFAKIYPSHKDFVLFMNIDASVIEYYIESDFIHEQIMDFKLNPSTIVLEINELPVESLELMKLFADKYKALGFLIAIDDIGAGSSNLDRIPYIMPDIMKIDKELISGIEESFYKKQVVSMIVQLATNLGALIVVEGVEGLSELTVISEFGAHLIQGYYLGKPTMMSEIFVKKTKNKINQIMEALHESSEKGARRQDKLNTYMKGYSDEIIAELEVSGISDFDRIIQPYTDKTKAIESIYVIGFNGRLVTETYLNTLGKHEAQSALYNPVKKGESVQLEHYYTKIVYEHYDFWLSKEYISMASGNTCYTLSTYFRNKNGNQYIICIDFHKDNLLNELEEQVPLPIFNSL